LEERKKNDHQKLYSGKIVGTRELQALEHEIETLGASISAGEDRVLEAMEKVEPLQAAVDKLRGYKKTAEEQLAALRAKQEVERKRFQADLAQAEPLRAPAAQAVDPSLLRSYEGIRRERKHPGLSVIHANACGHCHTSIPAFVMRRLQEGNEIIQCDNCTRIYYLPAVESVE
jgi:predicted  nucleic acid-binding Zn-ribbon protein